jgi:hypothetical protein
MAGPEPREPPDRYFFVHLQKTAGTTLRKRLEGCLGPAAVYPNRTDGSDPYSLMVSIEHLRDRLAVRGDEVQVIAGHFPLCTTELLDGTFGTFTVLREPVARTLSYLRHHRSHTPDDGHKTLEQIYDDPFRFEGFIHNHMVKMLSLTVDEMSAGMLTPVTFTGEHLERARTNVASLDVVGVQEDFDAFCADLGARFGWDLPDEPRFANQTDDPADDAEVDAALLDRIGEDQAGDVELYSYACALVAERRAHARELSR